MNHPYVDMGLGVRPTPVVEEEPQNNIKQEEITVGNKNLCMEQIEIVNTLLAFLVTD